MQVLQLFPGRWGKELSLLLSLGPGSVGRQIGAQKPHFLPLNRGCSPNPPPHCRISRVFGAVPPVFRQTRLPRLALSPSFPSLALWDAAARGDRGSALPGALGDIGRGKRFLIAGWWHRDSVSPLFPHCAAASLSPRGAAGWKASLSWGQQLREKKPLRDFRTLLPCLCHSGSSREQPSDKNQLLFGAPQPWQGIPVPQ